MGDSEKVRWYVKTSWIWGVFWWGMATGHPPTWLKEVKTEAFEAFRISVPWEALLQVLARTQRDVPISWNHLQDFLQKRSASIIPRRDVHFLWSKFGFLKISHVHWVIEFDKFFPWLRPTSWWTLIKGLYGRSWGGLDCKVGERILAAYWRTYFWHVSNRNFHVTQQQISLHSRRMKRPSRRWIGMMVSLMSLLSAKSHVKRVTFTSGSSSCWLRQERLWTLLSEDIPQQIPGGGTASWQQKKVARGCDKNRHTTIYAMCNMIFRCTTCGFGFFLFFRTLCYPACAQRFAPSENSSPLTLQWKLLRCLRNYSHLVCASGFFWEQGGKHIMNACTSTHHIPLEKIDV